LRLEKSEEWTLWFIDNFIIPFDNNLSERDLRMAKTRTKISWCFRSFEGAHYFCRIRSYISTLRKQGFDIYKAIASIFLWDVLLPNF
jgi:transposase